MTGKALSVQLSYLPDSMIAEALKPKLRRSKTIAYRVLRVAACVAVVIGLLAGGLGLRPGTNGIVTAPGILAVSVYALDETSSTGFTAVPLEEGVYISDIYRWPIGLNCMPGLPVYLSAVSEDYLRESISCDITVSSGKYLDDKGNSLGSKFTCSNDTVIFWSYDGNSEDQRYDHIYTDVIIRCENRIIGYAVLQFDRVYDKEHTPEDEYDVVLLASVLFPKVNGEYQDITQAYVEECIRDTCS